jgi:VanZ family protein
MVLFFRRFLKQHLIDYRTFYLWVVRGCFFLLFAISAYMAFTPASSPLVLMQALGDKVCHFLAFFVLFLFLDFGFPKEPLRYKFYFLCLYGGLIEYGQFLLGYRVFEWQDLLADGLGLLLYLACVLYLARYRCSVAGILASGESL